MSAPPRLSVEIFGARGSVATPGPATLRYGGNTTCISVVSASGVRVIFDAGTGIRELGRRLAGVAPEINLFLTHFHWDHIQGLPFFSPLIKGGSNICFHSGVSPRETRSHLEQQMSSPFFTLEFSQTKANCEFFQMRDKPVHCGDLAIAAFPLNHPQGAWGYHVESQGASVVIATDLEHGHPTLDQLLRERAKNADLLIYDSQYTESEYASRIGWGHSTPGAAAAAAAAAGVKQLLLFHHDPYHDDTKMDEIVAQTQTRFPETAAAQEGQVINL